MLQRMNTSLPIGTLPQAAPPAGLPSIDQLLAELAISGMSTAAFAREHGVAPSKLYYALSVGTGRRRKRKQSKKRALLPVVVKDHRAPAAAPLELQLSGGHRLLVPANFDEQALRRLMGVLAGC
jgi:hypothetical protein